jgi:hypothetical protein
MTLVIPVRPVVIPVAIVVPALLTRVGLAVMGMEVHQVVMPAAKLPATWAREVKSRGVATDSVVPPVVIHVRSVLYRLKLPPTHRCKLPYLATDGPN